MSRKKHMQLILLWGLLTAVLLPTVLDLATFSLVYYAATFTLFRKEIKSIWANTRNVWIGLSIFLCIGIFCSQLPEKSAKAAYDIIRFLTLFYFAAPLLKHSTDKELTRSLFVFSAFIGYTFLAITIYFQLYDNVIFIRDSISPYAKFGIGSHNHISTVTAAFLVLSLSLALTEIKLKDILILVLPLSYCIIVTLSRGNIVAVIFSSTFLLFYHFKFSCKIFTSVLAVFIFAFIYIFFFLECNNDSCKLNIFARQYIYQDTLALILDKPFFGYGLSVFKHVSGIQEFGENIVMPHNLTLELLYSVGLVGTVILIFSMLIWMNKSGWDIRNIFSSQRLPLPVIMALSMLIYLFTRGLFDLKLVSSVTFGLIAFSFALLCSRPRKPYSPQTTV